MVRPLAAQGQVCALTRLLCSGREGARQAISRPLKVQSWLQGSFPQLLGWCSGTCVKSVVCASCKSCSILQDPMVLTMQWGW